MEEQLTPTLQDYLRIIFLLQKNKGFARVRDISTTLNVGKSTVSAALRSLADKNLVKYDPYEPVTLTVQGEKQAQELSLRHEVVRYFIQYILDVEEDKAERAACSAEHAFEADVLERLICFLAFVGSRTEQGKSWLNEFRNFIQQGADSRSCEQCIDIFLENLKKD